jgi:hypothetical protein
MKEKRSTYTKLTDEERNYCIEECALLAMLAVKVTNAAVDVDLMPIKLYSGGSFAKCMMRNNGVPALRGIDRYGDCSPEIKDVLMRSYFGGWFDLAESGIHDEIYCYDLGSAYPAAMVELPCGAHGKWVRGNRSKWCIQLVSWRIHEDIDIDGDDPKFGPLPYRDHKGGNTHPCAGKGWYWKPEVNAAKKLPGYQWELHDQYSWVPSCNHKPFNFMPEYFEARQKLGSAGDMLKIAMNSGYGITADTQSDKSKYACVLWASLITSHTRTRILEFISEEYDNVIGIATDGIICKRPITSKKIYVAGSKELGQWELTEQYQDVLAIQPGVLLDSECEIVKSRGHKKEDLIELSEKLRVEWLKNGFAGQVEYSRSRFIGARLAAHRKDRWGTHGQWQDQPVTVSFKNPAGRWGINETPLEPVMKALVPLPMRPHEVIEISHPYNKLLSLGLISEVIEQQLTDEDQP